MKLKCSTQRGFTLIELLIVCSIIGLIAAVAVPHFIKARDKTNKSVCLGNLSHLDGAKVTWALELNKTPTDVPLESDLFGITAYIRLKPVCPGGGDDYMLTIGTVGTRPTCSLAASFGHSLP